MPIELRPYEESLIPGVRDFNARMLAAGVGREYLIPETVSRPTSSPVSSDWTVAVDGVSIRGGYTLQWRDFRVGDQQRRVAGYQTPISEGVIDKKYANVGLLILKHALRVSPYLYTTGMGGLDRPLPKMLKAMNWRLTTVPFRFRVVRPGRFLRQIEHLRTGVARRATLDLLAWSGAGWLGIRGAEWWSARRALTSPRVDGAEPFDEFGEWADALWDQHAAEYSLVGVRNAAALNALYPALDSRFLRWKLVRQGRVVGWVVGLVKQMQENKYFGNMQVGVIADAWSAQSDARWAVATAVAGLRVAGADVVVANTPHAAWLEALREERFLAGPSNHGFGVSPAIAQIVEPCETTARTTPHLMRGDGDGLCNFL